MSTKENSEAPPVLGEECIIKPAQGLSGDAKEKAFPAKRYGHISLEESDDTDGTDNSSGKAGKKKK